VKIIASAPGKLVVSGEYAVLAGAPALAVGINRRVVCTLDSGTGTDWHFVALGFTGEAHHSLAALRAGALLHSDDPGYLCQHIVRQLDAAAVPLAALPDQLRVQIDSRAGFERGRKLGIGTSAAVCAAVTAALLRLCNSTQPPFPIAQRAHHRSQGGRGSGIDVAAACAGGFIRYQRGLGGDAAATRRLEFPAGVGFAAIWTGVSAATRDYLERYEAWCAGAIPAPLQKLIEAAAAVADAVPDAAQFMRQLRAYAAALLSFDSAAQLGIYSSSHRTLSDLGTANGVVYKPCGAGGGDFGMAFAVDRQAIESFSQAARAAGFARLPLELDRDGITVGIEG
jgi:phosphomevalonate kinase